MGGLELVSGQGGGLWLVNRCALFVHYLSCLFEFWDSEYTKRFAREFCTGSPAYFFHKHQKYCTQPMCSSISLLPTLPIIPFALFAPCLFWAHQNSLICSILWIKALILHANPKLRYAGPLHYQLEGIMTGYLALALLWVFLSDWLRYGVFWY